jgi:hypothetical protein
MKLSHTIFILIKNKMFGAFRLKDGVGKAKFEDVTLRPIQVRVIVWFLISFPFSFNNVVGVNP